MVDKHNILIGLHHLRITSITSRTSLTVISLTTKYFPIEEITMILHTENNNLLQIKCEGVSYCRNAIYFSNSYLVRYVHICMCEEDSLTLNETLF